MEEPSAARTWKPRLAGIFNIVCGAIGVWGSVNYIVHAWSRGDIYVGVAVYMIGLVAGMGGVLAFGRRVWGLALSGAICALLVSFTAPWTLLRGPPLPPGAYYSPIWVWVMILGIPLSILGILAIVWIALSKQEFR